MKNKPNTDQFRLPSKDPFEFLDSGIADMVHQVRKEEGFPQKILKEQKVFRLPIKIIRALKTEAYERSMRSGLRVTETDLVELALNQLLKL
jgi:hypothetical protein